MKLGTVDCVKFKKLKAKLRITHWQCVGLLESLWMFTARNAPHGDIGRHSNEDIAVQIEWTDDPDTLISLLIECRWVDVCENRRLVIHDWDEHMPNWLKGTIKSQTIRARPKDAPKDVAKVPAKDSPKDIPEDRAEQVANSTQPLLFSSLLNSSQKEEWASLPDSSGDGARGTFMTGIDDRTQKFWDIYPKKTHKAKLRAALDLAIAKEVGVRGITDDQAFTWIYAAAMEYATSPVGKSPNHGNDMRPSPDRWLNDERYSDDRAEWMRPNGDARKPSERPTPRVREIDTTADETYKKMNGLMQ